MMNLNARVFVAGHRGMVGSAIMRRLDSLGYKNVITRSRTELDLTDQRAVADFFRSESVDAVYLAAARVGGIHANNIYPADFIYQNLMIEANVIHQACLAGVKKLLFLGSSCIYPRLAGQPMSENSLLEGKLEPTNEPYAIAKIAGIKLCESYNRQFGTDYRSLMPTNLYGPGDYYHPENSHVIPALLRRMHEAKLGGLESVAIWGTGSPRREFLYVDDMAAASVFIMDMPVAQYAGATQPLLSHVNVGTGEDITIRGLAQLIAEIVGYDGQLVFDSTRHDGAPRKLLDVEKLSSLGFRASTPLADGLRTTYADFVHSEQRS